jgi:hypothetical protein
MRPSEGRKHGTNMLPWIAAVLLGALAPALIVSGVSADIRILPLAFAVTLGHAVVIGLPVVLYCRAKRWTRLNAVLIGAFLIGALPGGLLTWPMNLSFRTTGSVDGVATIINGVPTLAGWLGYLKLVGMLGGLGAVGGLAFWLTLKSCGALAVADRDRAAPVSGQWWIAAALASAAAAASVAVAAIPSITMDRSCHNVFRDGRRSVLTSLNIDLDITMEEWPAVTTVLENFAVSHGMLFRNSSNSGSQVKVLGLSACTEQVVIDVIDQRWASRDYAPLMAGRGVPVWIYDLTEGNAWQPLARELVAEIEPRWPGKVRFRDGGGRLVPPSAVLMPAP